MREVNKAVRYRGLVFVESVSGFRDEAEVCGGGRIELAHEVAVVYGEYQRQVVRLYGAGEMWRVWYRGNKEEGVNKFLRGLMKGRNLCSVCFEAFGGCREPHLVEEEC